MVLFSSQVLGLSTDREQPINIEADQAEADDNLGVTIYRGDVIITQGSMRILGDTVTIHFDANQDITKVVAKGKPAKFRQQPDGDGDFQNAEAKTLEFYTAEDTIVMLGGAHSWQGENRIKAERIVYDTKAGKVRADSVQTTADTALRETARPAPASASPSLPKRRRNLRSKSPDLRSVDQI